MPNTPNNIMVSPPTSVLVVTVVSDFLFLVYLGYLAHLAVSLFHLSN